MKLDLYKFASKDYTRYFMCGVYHDNGKKIATDGHIMAIVKADYLPQCEGKIIDRYSLPLDGRFPSYQKVIPDTKDLKKMDFDGRKFLQELSDGKKILSIAEKIIKHKHKKDDRPSCWYYRTPNGDLMSSTITGQIEHFIKCYPDAELYQYDEQPYKSSAFIYKGSGTLEEPEAELVAMPLNGESVTEEHKPVFIGNIGFSMFEFRTLDREYILNACNKLDILKRIEFGTATAKDKDFL